MRRRVRRRIRPTCQPVFKPCSPGQHIPLLICARDEATHLDYSGAVFPPSQSLYYPVLPTSSSIFGQGAPVTRYAGQPMAHCEQLREKIAKNARTSGCRQQFGRGWRLHIVSCRIGGAMRSLTATAALTDDSDSTRLEISSTQGLDSRLLRNLRCAAESNRVLLSGRAGQSFLARHFLELARPSPEHLSALYSGNSASQTEEYRKPNGPSR